jgi:hypothetical protein
MGERCYWITFDNKLLLRDLYGTSGLHADDSNSTQFCLVRVVSCCHAAGHMVTPDTCMSTNHLQTIVIK